MNVNGETPRVSVVMANLNGAAHIADAVRSVLRQTETSLELIVSDDGSDDDSLAAACAAAESDARLVLLRSETRTGPAAARNRAVEAARGGWIAIVDNDDRIEPTRLKTLIDAAEQDGADIAADDLLTFYEDDMGPRHRHLDIKAPRWVDAAEYAESNLFMRGGAQLGYLKPAFRRAAMQRYDETLFVGEDSDLVLRMLIGGAKMRLYPQALYHYRKREGSLSHRMTMPAIEAMIAANARLNAGADARLRRALIRQDAALRDMRAFTKMVAAMKARDAAGAIGAAAQRPGALWILRKPLAARLRRRG